MAFRRPLRLIGPRQVGSAGLDFRAASWLFPAAFALHVAEEAPAFTGWVRRNAAATYTRTDFVRDNSLGMLQAVGFTVLVRRHPTRPVVFLYFGTLVSQQAANALFHAGTTVVFRDYSPGLATAAVVVVPLWWYLTRLAIREERVTARGAVLAGIIGVIIHAAVAARTVFKVGAA